MSDAAHAFLSAMEKLPRFDGLSFRGLPQGADPPQGPVATTGVHASSRSPRVATEDFSAAALLVLLNRTGRSIAEFSAHPEEQEVVVLPGTVWRPLVEVAVPGYAGRVLVIEELDLTRSLPQPSEWGATVAELAARVQGRVREELQGERFTVNVPGKFTGPWFSQELRQA